MVGLRKDRVRDSLFRVTTRKLAPPAVILRWLTLKSELKLF